MSPQEYTRIVQLYADDLYRLIFSYCHNASDAEDLLQNVFEKLLRNKKPFQNDDHVKRWLITVAVNECRSLFRSVWKNRIHFFAEQEELTYSDPEVSEVFDAVRSLPPKYRIPIHLHYYEGYSEKEIAEILRLPLSTVKARV